MDSVKKNRFDYLDIARAMNLEDNNASELGLGDDEYAFYTVLMQCESTK